MQETEKIWMNGELVDWADAKIHVGVARPALRLRRLRGHSLLRHAARAPRSSASRDHFQRLHNSARLLHMQIPYSVDELKAACNELLDANGAAGVLHPADRVLRLRRARRERAREPGRDRDHELAVGVLPRRRRAEERHPREDLVLAAHAAERHPARLEGDGRLPQLDARRHRGEQRRATTRRSC